MKKSGLLFVLLGLCISSVIYAAGGVMPGSGTAGDPYLIEDLADFDAFADDSSFWSNGVFTQLNCDLDLAPSLPGRQIYTQAPISPDADNSTSGFQGISYEGFFDGNGHTISNLSIDIDTGGNYLGLFGRLTGIVENLQLSDVDIAGDSYLGTITGRSEPESMIKNCSVSGSITGDNAGGLAGTNFGDIYNCSFIGNIAGGFRCGGLTGDNYGGISLSYSECEIAGYGALGGISSYNYGTISRCYSNSYIYGDSGLGGICSINENTISNCHAHGSVSSEGFSGYAGGICGRNDYDGVIENCYSTGPVSGYDSGPVIGGFYPNDDGNPKKCFWDINTTGIGKYLDTAQIVGKTTIEMKTLSTFVDAGWDFAGEDDGDEAIWIMPENSYPQLKGLPYITKLDGDGTESDPFLIKNQDEFESFVTNSIYRGLSVHTKLMCDIDLSENEYSDHVMSSFSGIFDGNNHSICNFTIIYDEELFFRGDAGIFGSLPSGSVVKNLHLQGVNISIITHTRQYDSNVGGLVSLLDGGFVENCSVNGNISQIDTVYSNTEKLTGGLIGRMNSGEVRNCSSSADVSGSDDVGGLIGFVYGETGTCKVFGSSASGNVSMNGREAAAGGVFGSVRFAEIDQCFATGTVTTTDIAGGLCGYSGDSYFSNCYSLAIVAASEDSWGSSMYLGGLFGYYNTYDNDIMVNCYAGGQIMQNSVSRYVGGLIGYKYQGEIESCFWDFDTTGLTDGVGNMEDDPAGIFGKTTAEMQDINTFLDAGWDFIVEGENGGKDIWAMDGYPKLHWSENVIDLGKLKRVVENWLYEGCSYGNECFYYDFNDDKKIDIFDFAYLAENWLERVKIKEQPVLVGHWKLDETIDSVAIDSSGYGRDGTVFGEPVRGVGKVDGCYVFDGVNDYVKIPFGGVGGSSERTVSAWIKADEDLANSEKNFHAIMSWGAAEAGNKWVFMLDANSGQLALSTYGGKLIGGPDLEDGQWHHVAVVLPAGSNNINQVKMYVDGVEIATNAGSLDAVIDSAMTEDVLIGAVDTDPADYIQSPTFFFKGEMDEVRIYNAAISESEISGL